MSWLDGITNSLEFEQALGVGDRQGSLYAAVHGVAKSWTWLINWTELNHLWKAKENEHKCVFDYGIYNFSGKLPKEQVIMVNELANNQLND